MNEATTTNTAPRRVSVAWPTFGKKLAAVLEKLREDEFLVISTKKSNRYVQFAGQGAFGLRAEAVSNHYLPRAERLDKQQIAGMKGLGWHAPTASARKSTPEGDPDGSPNFFVDFTMPVPCTAVAELAIRTLAEVLRVPHPGNLQYEAFDADRDDLHWPELGLKRTTRAEGAGELAPKLLATIKKETGIAGLEFDGDGDLGVGYGSAMAYVRLVGDPPYVRIHSPLVRGIEETPGLLSRINGLNGSSGHARFLVIDGVICAVTDVPASPYVPEHVVQALREFCQVSDGIDELLQAEFGGDTAFAAAMPSTMKH